jgi:hypothetical protein
MKKGREKQTTPLLDRHCNDCTAEVSNFCLKMRSEDAMTVIIKILSS